MDESLYLLSIYLCLVFCIFVVITVNFSLLYWYWGISLDLIEWVSANECVLNVCWMCVCQLCWNVCVYICYELHCIFVFVAHAVFALILVERKDWTPPSFMLLLYVCFVYGIQSINCSYLYVMYVLVRRVVAQDIKNVILVLLVSLFVFLAILYSLVCVFMMMSLVLFFMDVLF